MSKPDPEPAWFVRVFCMGNDRRFVEHRFNDQKTARQFAVAESHKLYFFDPKGCFTERDRSKLPKRLVKKWLEYDLQPVWVGNIDSQGLEIVVAKYKEGEDILQIERLKPIIAQCSRVAEIGRKCQKRRTMLMLGLAVAGLAFFAMASITAMAVSGEGIAVAIITGLGISFIGGIVTSKVIEGQKKQDKSEWQHQLCETKRLCQLVTSLNNAKPFDDPVDLPSSNALSPTKDTEAEYNLGVMYHSGNGVKQDYAEALKCFRKAADYGDARAENMVAVMYNDGQGVKQDYVEAAKWYRRATDRGNATAQSNLGGMYWKGQGVAQDYSEAVKLYRLAAGQGNAGAQQRLGIAYANGQGVAQDYVEAYKWFSLYAAAQGMTDYQVAKYLEAKIASSMTSEQIAAAQQRVREFVLGADAPTSKH